MFAFDRFEERTEVTFPKTHGATATLNDLKEEGRAGEDALGKELEQVAVVVAIRENLELFEFCLVLLDLADALLEFLVIVSIRHIEKILPHAAHLGNGLHDVGGEQRDVLHARALVLIEKLLYLRVGRGRFIDRHLHPTIGRAHDL